MGEVGEGFGAAVVFEPEAERGSVSPGDVTLGVGDDSGDPEFFVEPADADVGVVAGGEVQAAEEGVDAFGVRAVAGEELVLGGVGAR